MQRRDSGYESHQSGSARTSISHPRPVPPSRRMSSVSSAGGAATTTRTRTRPPTRPSAKSYPQSGTPSLYPRGNGGAQPPPGLFQFPAPDLVELVETASRAEPSPSPAAAHHALLDKRQHPPHRVRRHRRRQPRYQGVDQEAPRPGLLHAQTRGL
ncbi:hypothetical protein J3459_008101 [Metarhizium acridum]|nr:hypothetical protein J3459_008101 [Metarhizium acridum]